MQSGSGGAYLVVAQKQIGAHERVLNARGTGKTRVLPTERALRTSQLLLGLVDEALIFLIRLRLVPPGTFFEMLRGYYARPQSSLRRPRVLSQVLLLAFLTPRLGPLRRRHVSFGHGR